MENKIYGYVRISSSDQNEARQMVALNKVNVPEKNIYKNIKRPGSYNPLGRLMSAFRPHSYDSGEVHHE